MPLILQPGQTTNGMGTVGGPGGASPHISIIPVVSLGLSIPPGSSFSVGLDGWSYSVTGFTASHGASYDWSLTVSPSAQPGDYSAGWEAQDTPSGFSFQDGFDFTVIAGSGSSGGGSGSSGQSSGSGGGPSGPVGGDICVGCEIWSQVIGAQAAMNSVLTGQYSSSNLGNQPMATGNNQQGPQTGQYLDYGGTWFMGGQQLALLSGNANCPSCGQGGQNGNSGFGGFPGLPGLGIATFFGG